MNHGYLTVYLGIIGRRGKIYRHRLQALFRTQADERITEYRYLSAYFGHGTCLKGRCKGYVSGQTYSDDWPVSRVFSTAPEDQILWQAKMDILIQGRLLKDANMDQVFERLGKTKPQLLGEQSTAVNAYPSRDVRLEIPVNVEKWWYCTQCTARLDRINLMLKHKTNVHGKPTADQRCPDCMRVCGIQKALQQHLNGCHNYKCPFCPKMFKWISLLHQHGKDCRHYKCPVCPKTFDEMSLFQDHERSHLKDRPFSCPTCNNTFEREIDFREHQNFHPVDRPFACSICPKLYKTGPVLKNHQKTHLQDRQVSCSICQRTFSGTDTLRRHEKSKIHLQNIREQSSLGDGQERSTI